MHQRVLSLYTNCSVFSLQSHFSSITFGPETGEMVAGGVKEQAGQCFKNIKAILESIDHVMDDVVKVNIFLKNIADIDAVDEVYTTFFPGGVPARRTVGVSALPENALVQIDAVVSKSSNSSQHTSNLFVR